MNRVWDEKRLEILTLFVFILLVATSLFIFYTSYNNYTLLAETQSNKALLHKIIMSISSIIFFITLIVFTVKRDYFFMKTEDSQQELENLLEEIKYSSDPSKMSQFKQMLKEKNHTEVYGLISNMINELQESKKLADEANEAKTLFLSNVSHEIRTPLNGITGFTKILASTKLNNEQKDFIDAIRKSSEDLSGVVENILDVSKIESGLIVVEESSFNVFDAFENLANLYALEASKKGINFLLWIDPLINNMLVVSDEEKIKQILMNLISNAIKFTEQGGEVRFSIKKERMKKGSIGLKFEVTDTGIGISNEQQSKIFKAFTQADNSNTRKYGGTGLGLTIAQSWVKILGGELKLESVLTKGTSLTFLLNLSKKDIGNFEKVKGSNIALYTPTALQGEKSNLYLASYLTQIRGVNFTSFETFTDCKDADINTLDVLYLHYNQIDKEELQRIVAQYSNEIPLVLVTTLDNRFKILDIAPAFSQIIYEPVTFTKLQSSINTSLRNRELLSAVPSQEEKMFKLKSLIVEDNKVNQKLIFHTLKNLGIESDIADNGEIGVEMFKRATYDIVFMDIQMPVMNGVVATKEILKYEKQNNLDHTPIVAVTTNTLKGDREQCFAAGMDEYIAKPINAHKFISVVKQFYETETSELGQVLSSNRKTVLLYRQIPTEAKIMSGMLSDLGYSVEVAKSRVEFSDKLTQKSYAALILDRSDNDNLENTLMDKIYKNKMQALLFIDEESEIFASDLDAHIHLMYKSADFREVEAMVEKMVTL